MDPITLALAGMAAVQNGDLVTQARQGCHQVDNTRKQ